MRAAGLALGCAVAACDGVSAQTARIDPATIGPVTCYERALDRDLEHAKAMRLCTGARSTAPAACVAYAKDRGDLSELQLVRLCTLATSTAPARCAARVATTTDLSDATIVEYCAATQRPVRAARVRGSPECIRVALERTTLAEQDAERLCRGSRSTAPVQCFETGAERLNITDEDVVSLCAPVFVDGRLVRPER